MKKRIAAVLLLIIIIIVKLFNIKSYAVTLPTLSITSNNYSAGDKMNLDDIKEVKVGTSLQLYAVIGHGNDVWIPEEPESKGWFIDEANLSNITWSSSDSNIATISSTGNVTGVSEGKATITAKYNGSEEYRDAEYEITVTPKSNTEYTGIRFYYDTPGPGMNLNIEDKFSIGLYSIPKTEKENIKFRIENESIAKITKTEYDKSWADAIATVKYLSVGKTKITATLNYNGETYSDSYELNVIESNETLVLSAKEYKDLPTSLKIGDKLQLIATIQFERGSLIPKDVTSDGTKWESSNEKVVKIDENGMITAIGKGTATITATYEVYEGRTVKATYDLNVLNPNKDEGKKEDPTTADKDIPQAGENIILFFMSVVIAIAISIIAYRYYKKIK